MLKNPQDYAWLALLLPLAGCLLQALAGSRIVEALGPEGGKKLCGRLAVAPIALAFGVALYLFAELVKLPPESRSLVSTWFDWLNLQTLRVPFELRVDPLSVTMALIVTGVGALIHIYATGYMAKDRDYTRFFTYLNLFIVFMLVLVLGNNLPLVFIGWEGVGLCSYLLIGFWYEDVDNAKAANKAFIVNRIGDWGLVLGIFLIFAVFASNRDIVGAGETRLLSFDVILPQAERVLSGYGTAIVAAIPILLFIGAMGKSAQFPLYLWLPDAMAGPTPVSALIHAATMVTAGVYLVVRCHVFFELAPLAMLIVACVGAFTAIFAASIAFGQTDIKRVLAYSTVSQLGYMFLACGVGAFSTGMFHVTTHAFFKALLFLGSGSVIMAMAHNQDLRNYGNLRKYIPITYFTMLVGWLAISGIPPLAGFFSKDEILSKTFLSANYWVGEWPLSAVVLYGVGLVTAVMTAMYMTRMFSLTFYGEEERWRRYQPATPAGHAAERAPVSAQTHEAEEDPNHFYLPHPSQAPTDTHAASNGDHEEHEELGEEHTPREQRPAVWAPLVVLAAASVAGGAILAGFKPLSDLMGIETAHAFNTWNAPSAAASVLPADTMFHGTRGQELILVAVSIGAAVFGIGLMLARYRKGLPASETEMAGMQRAAGLQWFFDSAMYRLFVTWGGRFSQGVYRWFDAGVIDGLFVNGSAKLVAAFGLVFRRTQTGYVRYYAMTMLIGVVLILSYIIYASTNVGVAR